MGFAESSRTTYWREGTALAVLSLVINATFAVVHGVPRPSFHDEFSYLLAADTFAHGRLANPTHPFWEHFETIHVIQRPTYVSKYPPALGGAMALGQVTVGIPLAGVWLLTALACGVAPWVLRGWMTRRWAVVAALVLSLHPLVLKWNQTYWGGAPAMVGGLLLVGAAARLAKRAHVGDALIASCGMALLANSRPYEGLLLTVIVGGFVAVRWTRRGAWGVGLRRAVMPMGIAMSLVLAWMAYYNFRTTGNALTMPYTVHEREYGMAPLFVFQEPRSEPAYRHQAIQEYHADWSMDTYRRQATWGGYAKETGAKALRLAWEYTGKVALLVPLVAGVAVRRPRGRYTAELLGLFMVGLVPAVWVLPHYAAPAFPFLMVLAGLGMRKLWRGWRRVMVVVCGMGLLVALGVEWQWLASRGSNPLAFVSGRSAVIDTVTTSAEKSLIVVTYEGPKLPHLEWVYNGADIENAPVVWARDMGAERNAALLRHFAGRTAWRLIVRGPELQLERYR